MTRIRISLSRWLMNLADRIYSPPYKAEVTYGRYRVEVERIGTGAWPYKNPPITDESDAA